MTAVDHLILKARDLESGVAFLADRLGVASVQGGRHAGFGTHNAIVPLGSTYLEILAVYDAEEAGSNPFGRWALEETNEGIRVDAVVLRTDDLDAICMRNDLKPVSMTRVRPDGVELSWRLAGLDSAISQGLPAFIQWDVDDQLLPGTALARLENITLSSVEIRGDVGRLTSWIGDADGVSLSEGAIGFSAVFDTMHGQVTI